MSGAMRRIGEYLGLVEDTGRYDDEYADGYTDEVADRDADYADERVAVGGGAAPVRRTTPRREPRPAPVADLAERRRPAAPAAPVAARPRPAAAPVAKTEEPSRITTLHPRTYNEARTVGENYRDGTPVIMNLSEMVDDDAKRLVDFAAGLVFATYGSIERVTSKVFLLSPPNVTIDAEDRQRIAEGGFFNQS